jgi:hypothetical protein
MLSTIYELPDYSSHHSHNTHEHNNDYGTISTYTSTKEGIGYAITENICFYTIINNLICTIQLHVFYGWRFKIATQKLKYWRRKLLLEMK